MIRLRTGDLSMNAVPAPGKTRQTEGFIIFVGHVGGAVILRGMFVHPNQLCFALSQVPGIAGFQAVVIRLENRDELVLKVMPAKAGISRKALSMPLSEIVHSVCRINVDRSRSSDRVYWNKMRRSCWMNGVGSIEGVSLERRFVIVKAWLFQDPPGLSLPSDLHCG